MQHDGPVDAEPVHVRDGPLAGAEVVVECRRRGIVDPVSLASTAPTQGLAIDAQIFAVQPVPEMNVRINDHRLPPGARMRAHRV